ncbi:fumarylacetoacetate hydrolase family protein [Aeromicrobium fastidiosum]|uniref:Fumarylacetoacetate hydrolase family protein n=1 Tax=Aeromicrobium fastidiosum TaxID=52699 RepID=A0A641AQT0_9ACTN|nr:fumarylacetoacetate hydrolase family protein [Aeromicrobium fastidiosum]KAA1378605.1 fumarylacetoacetate hydrolase family protein [Aeromicrobium fastidiosum]MBP2392417.1 2-keto-4-pentenoate hydratase/2-oxohepta-3-ene-1,7-dioic acid hydratase in catechol pathway [Aeromicrobium fastidiosum]
MTLSVLRTDDAWWLQRADGAVRIDTTAATTRELLADRAAVEAARDGGDPVPVADLALVSPVTTPCRVVAQMTNFASHAKDANMDPKAVPLTFFRKASGSVVGPHDDIVRPAHVTLLDYEVEIGVVLGRELAVGTSVTAADLPELIAALVVTNDISARDVQLPKTQFYEGKSYPTFTPVGPALVILEPGELDRFADLRLQLWVNGELRQDQTADDIIYGPLEALQALSRFQHLEAGDLLLTGTPIGTALSAPPKAIEIIGSLLPAATKWKIFFGKQAKNPRYLQDGDLVETRIATDDGAIDLGQQRASVRWTR